MQDVIWSIRTTCDTADLRAAAYLRASCFYEFRDDRSEFSQRQFLWRDQSELAQAKLLQGACIIRKLLLTINCRVTTFTITTMRRMKADAEWESMDNKVTGREVGWEQTAVFPMIATIPLRDEDELCRDVRGHMMDLSSQIPAAGSGRQGELVIGTLDVNIGATLPAEELVGTKPQVDPRHGRAYLSNVCVAKGARRLGVAMDLIEKAAVLAQQKGALALYVHVIVDNVGALTLYRNAGFEVESEESANDAHLRQHGRRLLLCKMLL